MWSPFCSEGTEYYINLADEGETLVVRLTDMIYLWKEEISFPMIMKRYEESNPERSIQTNCSVEIILKSFIKDTTNIVYNVTKSSDQFLLEARKKMSDRLLSFNYFLRQCSPLEFYREVTIPLILIVNELQVRQDKLKRLLSSKDIEITEYQLEGGKLFRSYVKTEPFDDGKFVTSCNEECPSRMAGLTDNLGTVFSSEVNELYNTALKISSVKRENSEASRKTVEKIDRVPDELPKKDIKKWELPSQPNKRFKRSNAKVKL